MAANTDPVARRRNAVLVATLVLVLVGASLLLGQGDDDGWVKPAITAFLALLIVLRSTTSVTFSRKSAVADDELTRSNHAKAAFAGVWVAMLFAAAATLAGRTVDISIYQVALAILLATSAATGIRFAMLEARLS